jgi:hypothetical protein
MFSVLQTSLNQRLLECCRSGWYASAATELVQLCKGHLMDIARSEDCCIAGRVAMLVLTIWQNQNNWVSIRTICSRME